MSELQNVEIELFGKNYKVDGNGFLPITFSNGKFSGQNIKAIKPRARLNGKRATMGEFAKTICDFLMNRKTIGQAVKHFELDDETVSKYRDIGIACGYFHENDIVRKDTSVEEYHDVKNEEFEKRPEIQAWKTYLEKGQDNEKRARAQSRRTIGFLRNACEIVKCTPNGLICKDIYQDSGYDAWKKDPNSCLAKMAIVRKAILSNYNNNTQFENGIGAAHNIKMAVRLWIQFNDIPLRRNDKDLGKELGGKQPQETIGKYAQTGGECSREQVEHIEKILFGENDKSLKQYALSMAQAHSIDELLTMKMISIDQKRKNDKTVHVYPEIQTPTGQAYILGVATAGRLEALISGLMSEVKIGNGDNPTITLILRERKNDWHGDIKEKKIFYKNQTRLRKLLIERNKDHEFCIVGEKNQFCMDGIYDAAFFHEKQSNVRHMIQNLRVAYWAVGLRDPYWFKKPSHSIRHTAAHYWYHVTHGDISKCVKITGHKTREFERSYYQATDEQQEQQMNALIDADIELNKSNSE